MKVVVVLFTLAVAVTAQRYIPVNPDPYAVPTPYSFRYVATGDEAESSHEETGDGSGGVRGSYSINDAYGISRVVEYVADENGFRAIVRTNEPGTANQNPADVIVESSAPTGPVPGGVVPGPQPVRIPQPVGYPVRRPSPRILGAGGRGGYVLVPAQ